MSAALRTCEAPDCNVLMVGRRPQARYCSETCRWRAWKGQGAPTIKQCECCGGEFEPKRSDAHYCPACRRRRAYRRSPATAPLADVLAQVVVDDRDWLDGPKFAAWLEGVHADLDLGTRLNPSQHRQLQRWRNGSAASIYSADEVLVRLGRCSIHQIPAGIYTDDPHVAKPTAELVAA